MTLRLFPIAVALALAGLVAPAPAAESIGQATSAAARHTGHAVAETSRKAGHAVAETGREVGHASAEAGREVGHASAEAGRQVGHATAEAGRKTGQAFKHDTHTAKAAAKPGVVDALSGVSARERAPPRRRTRPLPSSLRR